MIIQSIQIGAASDGGQRAILSVGPDQAPGSVAGLRDYLQQQGLKASPGYDDGHLLRIRGLRDAQQLRALLTHYTKNNLTGSEPNALFDPATPFVPMDRGERQPKPFRTFIRQYSTGLAGLTSLISGLAFLTKDVMNWRKTEVGSVERAKAGIGTSAAGLFVAASASLTVLGFAAARKRSVPELIHDLEPSLAQGDALDVRDHRSGFQRGMQYAMNKPWLVSTILNTLGVAIKTTGHAIPSSRPTRNPFTLETDNSLKADRMELAASASSFVSLGFLATATPKESQHLLGIPSFEKTNANDPMQRRYTRYFPSPVNPENDHGNKGHANMKVAGLLAMASSIAFGVKGVLDVYAGSRVKDAIGQEARRSWPLLLVTPFNIAADYLTSISKPRFVYSLDELATETAAYIAKKLDMDKTDREVVSKQVFALSELLARHPRVQCNSHQLREAIAGRLQMDHGYEMQSNREGVQEYQHLWEVSPFTAAKRADKNPEAQRASAKESAPRFANKLRTQRRHNAMEVQHVL